MNGIRLWAWGEICQHLGISPEVFRLVVTAAQVQPYFMLNGVDYYTEADETKMFVVVREHLASQGDKNSEVTP